MDKKCNFIFFVLLFVIMLPELCSAELPKNLPEAEKEIADQVDPWGLPFTQQMMKFKKNFDLSGSMP